MENLKLEILICQTCESIYRKSYDNKLSEDEYAYFISSVALSLITGIYKDNEKKLRGEDHMDEDAKQASIPYTYNAPQHDWKCGYPDITRGEE